jgi:hypothetical protein
MATTNWKVKENIKANKSSGFKGNQQLLAFVNDLYSDYNVYDNHLTFFDKSFTSLYPLPALMSIIMS